MVESTSVSIILVESIMVESTSVSIILVESIMVESIAQTFPTLLLLVSVAGLFGFS